MVSSYTRSVCSGSTSGVSGISLVVMKGILDFVDDGRHVEG